MDAHLGSIDHPNRSFPLGTCQEEQCEAEDACGWRDLGPAPSELFALPLPKVYGEADRESRATQDAQASARETSEKPVHRGAFTSFIVRRPPVMLPQHMSSVELVRPADIVAFRA